MNLFRSLTAPAQPLAPVTGDLGEFINQKTTEDDAITSTSAFALGTMAHTLANDDGSIILEEAPTVSGTLGRVQKTPSETTGSVAFAPPHLRDSSVYPGSSADDDSTVPYPPHLRNKALSVSTATTVRHDLATYVAKHAFNYTAFDGEGKKHIMKKAPTVQSGRSIQSGSEDGAGPSNHIAKHTFNQSVIKGGGKFAKAVGVDRIFMPFENQI
jgi:hypothetical protein